MKTDTSRRAVLAASSSALAAPLGGCLGPEQESDDHTCPETWNVVAYNESDEPRSATVTILDGDDQVAFSDTVELDAKTDRFSGVELDAGIYYDRSYTFEADLAKGGAVSEEFEVKCGNVYVFVTESGEPVIRDDEIDHV